MRAQIDRAGDVLLRAAEKWAKWSSLAVIAATALAVAWMIGAVLVGIVAGTVSPLWLAVIAFLAWWAAGIAGVLLSD